MRKFIADSAQWLVAVVVMLLVGAGVAVLWNVFVPIPATPVTVSQEVITSDAPVTSGTLVTLRWVGATENKGFEIVRRLTPPEKILAPGGVHGIEANLRALRKDIQDQSKDIMMLRHVIEKAERERRR